MITRLRFSYYMLTTLTNTLLFFSGIALVGYGFYWGALIALGSFVTGLLVEVHYFRVMSREVNVSAPFKGALARNAEEFGWEQVGEAMREIASLKSKVAVLEDRFTQKTNQNQIHFWLVSAVISGIATTIAILAFLGVHL